jgi:hypothetical protein
MEKYRPPELMKSPQRISQDSSEEKKPLDEGAEHVYPRVSLSTEETAQGLLREREKRTSRRKWAGRGLIVFGMAIVMGSCPLYAFSVVGPGTIMAGLVLIAGGAGLIAWRPRFKDTNEAILVALKHGNRLTTPGLALEMDITFEKSEKIMRELVKNGIAEIDLDHKDADHTIVYRIKGM